MSDRPWDVAGPSFDALDIATHAVMQGSGIAIDDVTRDACRGRCQRAGVASGASSASEQGGSTIMPVKWMMPDEPAATDEDVARSEAAVKNEVAIKRRS